VIAAGFTVVAADLPGYGASSCPPTDLDHRPYSKSTMAANMLEVMLALGFERFSVMGHDRGANVAYRLALEYPDRVARLVLLGIISTLDHWHIVSQFRAARLDPWAFLAQPAPLPESLIGRSVDDWVEGRFKRSTRDRSISAIDPRAMAAYKRAMSDPDRIHASCEDFRASAWLDIEDDLSARAAGLAIACPALALWGRDGPLSGVPDVLGLWQPWCRSVLTGHSLDCGHYIAEEQPEQLLAAVLPFLQHDRERCA
jgi:haloacetate dehalogenase